MIHHDTTGISYMLVGFVCFGVVLIAGLLVAMKRRHSYDPNLIGALIGALLCFVLLETLPALT